MLNQLEPPANCFLNRFVEASEKESVIASYYRPFSPLRGESTSDQPILLNKEGLVRQNSFPCHDVFTTMLYSEYAIKFGLLPEHQ